MTRDVARESAEAGVSLIELMIALVVIAVGILALSGVQSRSSEDVFATGRESRAVSLAQTQIEATRGAGYAAALSDSGTSDGFTWRTQVDSANVDLKQITVTVSWNEASRSRSVQLNSLVSAR